MKMNVIKRSGKTEEMSFDKICERIKKVSEDLPGINIHFLSQKVIQGLKDNITTSEIDMHTSELAHSMCVEHMDYNILASRIAINNHHRNTLTSFKDKMDVAYLNKDINGNSAPLIHKNFYKFVVKNQRKIEDYIDYNRDYLFDYFGFKTLEKSYLLKTTGRVEFIETDQGEERVLIGEFIERPQDMFMRVSIALQLTKTTGDLHKIFETYDLLSLFYCTYATPILFNAGLVNQTLASCFLLGTEDTAEAILKTLCDASLISKGCGGIGLHISNIRANGSYIRGINGLGSGIMPILRQFQAASECWKQSAKRSGSFAIYLEPHHADIMDFLDMRRMTLGKDRNKAENLFSALWISDLFMKRVESDDKWSVFCPDECPGLSDVYGQEYEDLYLKYENEKRYRKVYKAKDVWKRIIASQVETGTPYMLYKDTVNEMSNQKNIGIIRSSNLCSEIVEYSSSTEYACCTLASIGLPMFVVDTIQDEEEKRELNHRFPKHGVFD